MPIAWLAGTEGEHHEDVARPRVGGLLDHGGSVRWGTQALGERWAADQWRAGGDITRRLWGS